MTDVTTGSLPAEQARAEALLVKARRDTGNPDLTLDEAEAWWREGGSSWVSMPHGSPRR